jgi:hypothetical protein
MCIPLPPTHLLTPPPNPSSPPVKNNFSVRTHRLRYNSLTKSSLHSKHLANNLVFFNLNTQIFKTKIKDGVGLRTCRIEEQRDC